jgi:DNA mismatch repair protein MutS2
VTTPLLADPTTTFLSETTRHHLNWEAVQALLQEACLSDWGVWHWESMPFFDVASLEGVCLRASSHKWTDATSSELEAEDDPAALPVDTWLEVVLESKGIKKLSLTDTTELQPWVYQLHAWHTRCVTVLQALYLAEGPPPPLETLRQRLHQVSTVKMSQSGAYGALPSYTFSSPYAHKPAWRVLWQRFTKQAPLTKHEWATLFVVFQALQQWVGWLKNNLLPTTRKAKAQYPWVFEGEAYHQHDWQDEGFTWIHHLPPIHHLLGIMNQYLDPDTLSFRLDASPTYATLVSDYRTLQQDSMRLLEDIARQWGLGTSGMSRGVTEREGRWVLPVPTEQYHTDMGVIVARSEGGRLVYVEPKRFAKIQQQLLAHHTAMLQEEQRLLDAIATHWQEGLPKLSRWWHALGMLERLHASALVANQWHGVPVKTSYQSIPAVPQDASDHTPNDCTSQCPPFYLPEAKHPLLLLHPPKQVAQVYGNTLTFGTTSSQCLLISGPNAGGKTMSLKTLGLLVCLHRAGVTLPITMPVETVPLQDKSMPQVPCLPWLKHLITYLGDGQNIEEGLSSFSAYLTWLKDLALEEDKTGWLILMDEIAAATDPTEGGALAQAILDTLVERRAWVCVTTHLETLKRHAMQHAHMQNASMVFDPVTMTPTYRLLVGIPGASHTLHIATRYHLPERLLAKAQAYRHEHSVWSEELIAKMERQMLELHTDQQTVSRLKLQLTEQEMQLSATLKRLNDEKHGTLRTWRTQLKTRLERTSDSLSLLERTLRQKLVAYDHALPELPKILQGVSSESSPSPLPLPETPEQRAYLGVLAFQAKLKQLEQQGLRTLQDLEALLEEEALTLHGDTPLFTFKKGESVFCVTLNELGCIEKLHPNTQEATLRLGLLTAKVALKDLRPQHWRDPGQAKRAVHQALAVKAGLLKQRSLDAETSRQAQIQAQHAQRANVVTHETPHRLQTAKEGNPAVCDLRGLRASEALELLDIHLDRCLPSGISPIRCIHGQGTGALKRAVRDHIAKHPLVAHWHPEAAMAGGDGVTVLYFEAPSED